MVNRIRGLFTTVEQLMQLPGEGPLGDPGEVASGVTKVNPLKMYLPKLELVEAIEMNLAAIEANRDQIDDTPEKRAYTDAMIRQRQLFLAELAASEEPMVFVALYPDGEMHPA